MTARSKKKIISFLLVLCMLFGQFHTALADSADNTGSDGTTAYTVTTENGIEVVVTAAGGGIARVRRINCSRDWYRR